MDKTQIYLLAQVFLDKLFSQLQQRSIEFPSHWDIDHLCFRTTSFEDYQRCKLDFAELGQMLIESEVGGRPIATFKLYEPILYGQRKIELIELPAPKKGKLTSGGFEHIEIVCDRSFQEIQMMYPQAQFSQSGLQKDFNPELEMEFEAMAIKFHHLSLESVIRIEKNQKVSWALRSSHVLQDLRDHSPEVVGTFPLGIDGPRSDLDILIHGTKKKEMSQKLQGLYGRHLDFLLQETAEYVIASFKYEGVKFEIFCQDLPPTQQVAFKHFQVEERLLKWGGDRLSSLVRDLRSQGMKTEPAFQKALGLKGNPYEALLQLFPLSDEELKSRMIL